MISQFVKGRVYVFIDVANIFYSQRTLKWKISYEKLMKYFKKECDLGKCFVYTGIFEKDHAQEKIFENARKMWLYFKNQTSKKDYH